MKRPLMTLILSTVFLFVFTSLCGAEALTAELCKAKAKAAAALLGVEGDAALETIKDPNGEFRFADGEGYIWVHNLDGIMVMHPIKPSLDGKGLLMRSVGQVLPGALLLEACHNRQEIL